MSLSVGILIFDDFKILDVFGPIEMLGMYPKEFEIALVSENGGEVRSAQGPRCLADSRLDDDQYYDVTMVPGGAGTRAEVNNARLLNWIRYQTSQAQFITSVCTGSAVLAKAGVLDGRKATSNKMNFDWVVSQVQSVQWQYEARWVVDGTFFTSSGVSAGMDMTLELISHVLDAQAADDAALWAEYSWHRNPDADPFAEMWRGQENP